MYVSQNGHCHNVVVVGIHYVCHIERTLPLLTIGSHSVYLSHVTDIASYLIALILMIFFPLFSKMAWRSQKILALVPPEDSEDSELDSDEDIEEERKIDSTRVVS